MKASTPIFKILSAAILVAVVLYFGVQLRNYLSDPISTTLIYAAQTEDAIAINGYLVRDEETFSSTSGTLSHTQSEGAKVGVGQTLAVAYANGTALDTVETVEALRLQLEQLQFALASYLDSDAALKLDGTITDSIITLRRNMADGNYTLSSDELAGLKAAVMKRDYTYTTKEEIEASISRVEEEIRAQEGTLSGATNITAPQAGTYSAVCDGYETVLTPEMLTEMTVQQLNAVHPASADANVGKLIYGDRWYYAASITEADAALLDKRSRVTVRFAKGLNIDVTMNIDHIGESEGGQCLLVLYCDRYLAETTMLRHQAADIVLRGYQGLRVPSNALRVSEEGISGVYCVVGVTARFKPVDVVYQGEGFVLVRASDSSSGSTILRAGDEVIVTNGELFDGKVVG